MIYFHPKAGLPCGLFSTSRTAYAAPRPRNKLPTNRGSEAVAFADGKLYAFIQSLIDNPDVEDDANSNASIINRIC